jgi:ribosomal protein S18 acetylase RimI-like enzyme
MRVRRLAPGDEPEIVRATHLFDEPADPEAARLYLADDRNVFLLAETEGRAVGFVRATELRQLKTTRRQMFLYEIEVDARYRRRGIGRELVDWLLRYCRERRFDEMFVFTDPSNEAAVTLYRSTGGVTETPADRMYVFSLSPASGAPS